MSKEKQKFFRQISAGKKRDTGKPLAPKNQIDKPSAKPEKKEPVKADTKKVNNKPKAKEVVATLQLSESDSSSSSSSDESDRESSSSSSNCSSSSSASSEDSDSVDTPIKNISPKQAVTVATPPKTFGSLSSINVENDSIWGFAAAAAKAKVKNEPLLFSSFMSEAPDKKEKTVITNNNTSMKYSDENQGVEGRKSNERVKPAGIGQLRGLYDGLSHFFSAPVEGRNRNSNTPNYNPNRRKKQDISKNGVTDITNAPKDKRNGAVVESADVQMDLMKAHKRLLMRTEKSDEMKLKEWQNAGNQIFASLPDSQSSRFSYPVLPSEEDKPRPHMTPSNLVKTAVYSKRHELERRKFLKSETGLCTAMGFSHSVEDARSKKRNLIAEATQLHHPMSMLPITSSQTGKKGSDPL